MPLLTKTIRRIYFMVEKEQKSCDMNDEQKKAHGRLENCISVFF